LVWSGLWLVWLWRSGRLLGRPGPGRDVGLVAPEEPGAAPGRPEFWLILGGCSIPTLVGAWMEQPAMTPEAALVRAVGLVGWVGLAWGVMAVARAAGGLQVAISAAAVAMAAQSLIDMGGTFQTSCCLVLGTLGLAAAAPGPWRPASPPAPPTPTPPAGAARTGKPRRMAAWLGLLATFAAGACLLV